MCELLQTLKLLNVLKVFDMGGETKQCTYAVSKNDGFSDMYMLYKLEANWFTWTF